MSAFDAIDLSRLPPPQVVEPLDFEGVLAAMRTDLAARAPQIAEVLDLESEPAVKLLELVAYREVLLRGRVNDAAKAVMLATATGADLDNLAAFYGVARLTLEKGDPDARPPVPPVLEADADLRGRVQLALEGFTSAGPVGAYLFHARSAAAEVADAAVDNPSPGTVRVTVLGAGGDGTPSAATLAAVEAALGAKDVRPLCDSVLVRAASIVPYTIDAALTIREGPDAAVVLAEAQAAAEAYAAETHRIGREVPLSGIYAALHRPGVVSVDLTAPGADIAVGATEAPHATAIALSEAA